MTKDTRAKPSAGAMEAAREAIAEVLLSLSPDLSAEDKKRNVLNDIAHMIDSKMGNPERDKLARELAEAWLNPTTDDHTPEELDEVARKLLRLL